MKVIPLKSNQTEVRIGEPGKLMRILVSYETPVAVISSEGMFKTSKKWSRTTSKHINQWLYGSDEPVIEKPQEWFDHLLEGKDNNL